MRHLRVLLSLLVLSAALPCSALADTGWSQEAAGLRRTAAAAPSTLAAPARPFTLFAGFGADVLVVVEPGSRGPRVLRCREGRRDGPADHAPSLLAAHSRLRAAQRSFLQIGPSLALATRGVVGFHASPAPPLA